MKRKALEFSIRLITDLCAEAAPTTMLWDLHRKLARLGIKTAVAQHDTPALVDWLLRVFSYQGVSDAIAWAYMNQHGAVTFTDLEEALRAKPSCPKLNSHWHYDECRFAKHAFTCSEPDHLDGCPLPQHDLRNGRLNQTAYSLFLFVRDVCDGDLVGWIDQRLAAADQSDAADRGAVMQAALLEPLGCIYGVSSKVLSMTLADLLLAGDPERRRWVETGAGMIAVDTLVHNWLHRTGILRRCDAEHGYGAACYAVGGCADIIAPVSQHIDARAFCPEGPADFPRLIQKAIWLFCSEGGMNECNGNRIDDRSACRRDDCALVHSCERMTLR